MLCTDSILEILVPWLIACPGCWLSWLASSRLIDRSTNRLTNQSFKRCYDGDGSGSPVLEIHAVKGREGKGREGK